MDFPKIILKQGKEKALRNHHPWLFSGAIAQVPKAIAPGSVVSIFDARDRFLAQAYYNPKTSLAARIFSFEPGTQLDSSWLFSQIERAVARRAPLVPEKQTMRRLVASEADYLPGLIVDQYDQGIVFQILTSGMERVRDQIIEVLIELFDPEFLIERSDEAIREREGLGQRKAWIRGAEPECMPVSVWENGLNFLVDCWNGHKTGFYLDQRNSRALIQSHAHSARVLNCFCYTGGFSVSALAGGAVSVLSVDESAAALSLAEKNCQNNPHPKDSQVLFDRADVFKYLRELKAQGETFDLIVLDPPKFIHDRRHIDRACRGYKDLNLLAMSLLSPNGLLASFSCSGLMSQDLFKKVVFGASVDAGVEMHILKNLSQSEDHPIRLSFPESSYLKGFLLKRV